MEKVKVFIIDDSVVARKMLIRMLSSEPFIEIVGEAGTGQGGIIMFEEAYPDIIFLEANVTGGMRLVDVISEIKAIDPKVAIVLCVDPDAKEKVIEATTVGVFDFIRKPYQKSNILRVIREAAEENAY